MKRTIFITVLIPLIIFPANAREISLTVYNNNLALVHEVREIDFQKGAFTYKFTSIPSQIDPTSVHFRAQDVEILEQNYEFDIASPEKIQQKFIGEKVMLFFKDGSSLEGLLQPNLGAGIIILDPAGGVKIVNTDELQHYDFPRLPENFVERPTLIWLLKSASAGKRKAEVSYLTGGMNWHAEYVAVTGEKELGLAGWVSIDNRSGESYEEAKLKLMAGELHTVTPPTGPRRMAKGMVMDMEAKQPQFEEKAFFEYHLYTLQRPSTVKNNQIKQISLFPEARVKYSQEYVYDTRFGDDKIRVYLVFRNDKDSGLGMPLPAGKVRIYQRDEDGSQEFIGEDMLKHTPRDEKVKLEVGTAFDLVGEKRVKDTRQISRTDREEDIEISLRNHKETPVEIIIREHLYRYWTITQTTHKYEKIDAYTIEFRIAVPPHKGEEETLVKYTVHYTSK